MKQKINKDTFMEYFFNASEAWLTNLIEYLANCSIFLFLFRFRLAFLIIIFFVLVEFFIIVVFLIVVGILFVVEVDVVAVLVPAIEDLEVFEDSEGFLSAFFSIGNDLLFN